MITLVIIAITVLVSYMAFQKPELMNKLIYYPPAVEQREWHRLITHGFIHADYSHLIFNMLALYMFGSDIEGALRASFGEPLGSVFYIVLYLSGIVMAILPTHFKERNNAFYRSLGASGAVSAIVFAYIMLYPMNYMGLMFIPVFLPAFIFGFIYIAASIYLDKHHSSNINHSAHVTGALFGILYMFIVFQLVAQVNIFEWFINRIQINSIGDLIKLGYS